jgi:hypothetical protein
MRQGAAPLCWVITAVSAVIVRYQQAGTEGASSLQVGAGQDGWARAASNVAEALVREGVGDMSVTLGQVGE